jgi:hypothetical protein
LATDSDCGGQKIVAAVIRAFLHCLKALLAKCKLAWQTKKRMNCDTSKFDQKLLGFWCAAREIYNLAVKSPSEEASKLASVKIASFFVVHSFRFAEASLMLAANDDILPAVALMRPAIEAQARANHLISFTGQAREDKATELILLDEMSRKYYAGLMLKSVSSINIDWANIFHWTPEARAQVTKWLAEFDVNKHEEFRKKRNKLRKEWDWDYGTVIGRKFFNDPQWNMRAPFQRIQQSLAISFEFGSSAIHPDLMSHLTEKMISAHEIISDATAVAVCVVYCYLVAAGRQNDPQFNQLVTEYDDYVWSKLKESTQE